MTTPPPATVRHAFDELVEMAHPLLEQVSDGRWVATEQECRRLRFEVLAEHENGDLRVFLAEQGGGGQPLIRLGRRHPHVGDDELRAVLADSREQGVAVADLGDDVEPLLAQQSHDPRPDEHGILRHDHPDGGRVGQRQPLHRPRGHRCTDALQRQGLDGLDLDVDQGPTELADEIGDEYLSAGCRVTQPTSDHHRKPEDVGVVAHLDDVADVHPDSQAGDAAVRPIGRRRNGDRRSRRPAAGRSPLAQPRMPSGTAPSRRPRASSPPVHRATRRSGGTAGSVASSPPHRPRLLLRRDAASSARHR